jgi:hypothetical protein
MKVDCRELTYFGQDTAHRPYVNADAVVRGAQEQLWCAVPPNVPFTQSYVHHMARL